MLRIFLLLNYPSQNQLFMVKYVWAAAIMGLSVSEWEGLILKEHVQYARNHCAVQVTSL